MILNTDDARVCVRIHVQCVNTRYWTWTPRASVCVCVNTWLPIIIVIVYLDVCARPRVWVMTTGGRGRNGAERNPSRRLGRSEGASDDEEKMRERRRRSETTKRTARVTSIASRVGSRTLITGHRLIAPHLGSGVHGTPHPSPPTTARDPVCNARVIPTRTMCTHLCVRVRASTRSTVFVDR